MGRNAERQKLKQLALFLEVKPSFCVTRLQRVVVKSWTKLGEKIH